MSLSSNNVTVSLHTSISPYSGPNAVCALCAIDRPTWIPVYTCTMYMVISETPQLPSQYGPFCVTHVTSARDTLAQYWLEAVGAVYSDWFSSTSGVDKDGTIVSYAIDTLGGIHG